jgi:DNA-binding NtrC family response regulator
MNRKDVLKSKVILAVDDEPDVLDTLEGVLDICLLHKAEDYETAHQHLLSFNYDAVVLDIMGVRGFDLLKVSVSRGFPTVMLTAHALSPESLKKSIKLGAVTFLPKDKLSELPSFLEDAVFDEGRPLWKKLFDSLGEYFNERFGPDWKEKDRFLKEFIEQLKKEKQNL